MPSNLHHPKIVSLCLRVRGTLWWSILEDASNDWSVCVCVCLYQTHSQSIHMHFFHDKWTNLTKLHSPKKNRPSMQVWVSVARIKSPFLQQPILNSIQVDRLLFDLSGVAMANGVFHSDWSPLPWQELRLLPLPPSYPLFWHLSSVPLWLLSPLPWLKVVGRWEWNDQKTNYRKLLHEYTGSWPPWSWDIPCVRNFRLGLAICFVYC